MGFGGNAVDFFDLISDTFEIIGFVDDDIEKHDTVYNGVRVYGRKYLEQNHQVKIVSLMGSEKTFKMRKEIIKSFNISPERFNNVIHPNAVIGRNVMLGHNVVIMAGVVITSNAKVGNHVFIMANTVIHHDVEVSDYSLIGSNVVIAGHTRIGPNCYIGSGSNIINGITLGAYTMVGLGSNVINSVPAHATIAGNPAKTLSK